MNAVEMIGSGLGIDNDDVIGTLADPFGYPLRLRTSTKLGYKNPKGVAAIEVAKGDTGGDWESLGFPCFAGI